MATTDNVTPLRPKKPRRSISKEVFVDVDVDLDDFEDEELLMELELRGAPLPDGIRSTEVERLYYATRGDSLSISDVRAVHALLAVLYGRSA